MAITDLAPIPTAGTPASDWPAFTARCAQGGLTCNGVRIRLATGSADDLGSRVAGFFAADPDGPGLLVGALPFDRNAPDYLFQPQQVQWLAAQAADPAPVPNLPPLDWRLVGASTPARYAAAVTRALRLLNGDDATGVALRKVVLARSIELEASGPVDIQQVARLLATNRHAMTFSVQLPAGVNAPHPGCSARYLVGASPELLVAKHGRQVRSWPLAGSARRGCDDAEDRAAAQALQHSDKDRREHQAVVEAVLDTLAPYCSQLPARPQATLRPAANLWHLGTPIDGVLRNPDTSSAELAAALHPTPAVCGLPRPAAYSTIRELEAFDRGFYAGAVGWSKGNGDGEWHVAIRCAEIEAARVRLYAGAGIVPGSDPVQETRETAAKFAVMLQALGIEQQQLDNVLEAVA